MMTYLQIHEILNNCPEDFLSYASYFNLFKHCENILFGHSLALQEILAHFFEDCYGSLLVMGWLHNFVMIKTTSCKDRIHQMSNNLVRTAFVWINMMRFYHPSFDFHHLRIFFLFIKYYIFLFFRLIFANYLLWQLIIVADDNAGEIGNITGLRSSQVSFLCILFILHKLIPTFQIHQDRVNKGLHHVVIKVKPFCIEFFKHGIQFFMIDEVIFECAEHDFQIQNGSLWIGIVDLDVRQEERMHGWWQFIDEHFSNGNTQVRERLTVSERGQIGHFSAVRIGELMHPFYDNLEIS